MAEFVKLAELPCLEDLVFVGNLLEEKHSAENWIEEATKTMPKLKINPFNVLLRYFFLIVAFPDRPV